MHITPLLASDGVAAGASSKSLPEVSGETGQFLSELLALLEPSQPQTSAASANATASPTPKTLPPEVNDALNDIVAEAAEWPEGMPEERAAELWDRLLAAAGMEPGGTAEIGASSLVSALAKTLSSSGQSGTGQDVQEAPAPVPVTRPVQREQLEALLLQVAQLASAQSAVPVLEKTDPGTAGQAAQLEEGSPMVKADSAAATETAQAVPNTREMAPARTIPAAQSASAQTVQQQPIHPAATTEAGQPRRVYTNPLAALGKATVVRGPVMPARTPIPSPMAAAEDGDTPASAPLAPQETDSLAAMPAAVDSAPENVLAEKPATAVKSAAEEPAPDRDTPVFVAPNTTKAATVWPEAAARTPSISIAADRTTWMGKVSAPQPEVAAQTQAASTATETAAGTGKAPVPQPEAAAQVQASSTTTEKAAGIGKAPATQPVAAEQAQATSTTTKTAAWTSKAPVPQPVAAEQTQATSTATETEAGTSKAPLLQPVAAEQTQATSIPTDTATPMRKATQSEAAKPGPTAPLSTTTKEGEAGALVQKPAAGPPSEPVEPEQVANSQEAKAKVAAPPREQAAAPASSADNATESVSTQDGGERVPAIARPAVRPVGQTPVTQPTEEHAETKPMDAASPVTPIAPRAEAATAAAVDMPVATKQQEAGRPSESKTVAGIQSRPSPPVSAPVKASAPAEDVTEVSETPEEEGLRSGSPANAVLASKARYEAATPEPARQETRATQAEAATDRPAPASASPSGTPAPHMAMPPQAGTAPVEARSLALTGNSQAVPAAPVIEAATLDTLGDVALRSIRLSAPHGEQTITVRLSPASLGEVRIEVTHSQDSMNIRLASANASVREILEAQSPHLRQNLALDGIEKTNVSVSAQMSSGQDASGSMGRQAAPPAPQPAYTTTRSFYSGAQPSSLPRTARGSRHEGALNVFV